MYIITKDNPYVNIGTKYTTNWDCTYFYINGTPMEPQQVKAIFNKSEVMGIIRLK
jgi:hypothetical protein